MARTGKDSIERRKRGRFIKLPGAVSCVVWMLLSAMPAMAGSDYEESSDSDADYAPGELLIKFKDGASDDDKGKTKDEVGAESLQEFKDLGVKHWKLGNGYDIEKALKEFDKEKYDDIIEFAEPNYYYTADSFPTDPARGEQWDLHNIGQAGGSIDADVDMAEYWNSPGSEGSDVVVALVDSGVDYNHPELKDHMWKNPGETPGDGKDNDGNGYIDDVYGYDFHANDGDPMDDDGHGTRCAGIIAADSVNGQGINGMSSRVKIMAVRCMLWRDALGFTTANAVNGINYAASFTSGGNKVVKVICGCWGHNVASKTLETAIKNCGALFVASAGNQASSTYRYPAAYTMANIVSVAATDKSDGRAPFSNWGSDWVDLGAPGVDIYSSEVGGGYKYDNGTSMAAAHIAGAAALWWSNNPSATVTQTKAKMLDNVEGLSSLSGKCVSGGRLSVRKMYGLDPISGSGTPNGVSDLGVVSGSAKPYTLKLTWTAVGEGESNAGTEYAYDVRYVTGQPQTFDWDNAQRATVEPTPKAAGGTETFTVTGLVPSTTYTFAIKVLDEVGNVGPISTRLATDTTADPYWDLDGNIDSGSGSKPSSVAFDGSGKIAMAYVASSAVKFARIVNGAWTTETVDSVDSYGMGLAWDGSTWVVAYGNGPLKFAKRNPETGAWSTQTLESRGVVGTKGIDVYKSGSSVKIGISYGNNALMYAEYDGTSWTKTTVDKTADARYNSLAFDSSGEPAIAYSISSDSGLKYAKRSSGTWSVQTVASYFYNSGWQADIALDSNDRPYITCSHHWVYLFIKNDAGGWNVEVPTPEKEAYSAALTLVESGGTVTPYIVFSEVWYNNMIVTAKIDGKWTAETVELDSEVYVQADVSYYSGADGAMKLGVCYDAARGAGTDGITCAVRDLKNPSSWG